MRHERFLEPLAADDPCGPDLDEIGDEEYLNYLLPAEARLPARFFDLKEGRIFDRSQLDLKSELKQVDALLERSRDLRLICLEARFQAFAGSFQGVCDCIVAIDSLLERFFDHVHPRPLDEDDPVRQSLIGALDDRSRIIQPLHYAPLLRDRRLGQVTWRQYELGAGLAEPREGETPLSESDIQQALASTDNSEATEALHAALSAALAAMNSIRRRFEERGGYESAPDFGGLREFFLGILKLIESARRDLAGNEPPGEETAGEVRQEMAREAAAAAEASPAAATVAQVISSHAQAISALMAAETYLAQHEPSAPALLLIHQARLLVGRPLIQAIEMLMPEAAERAVIQFEPGVKFQLAMGQMRALSQDVEGLIPYPEPDGELQIPLSSRTDVANLLAAIEGFYRTAEPSSPIPMLLAKARAFLNRDFTAIINDLITKEDY
jgi:type VI secretion system protein ImpA